MPVGSMPYLTRSGLPAGDAAFELLAQLVLGDDLLDAAADEGELFVDRTHGAILAHVNIWNRPTASKAFG